MSFDSLTTATVLPTMLVLLKATAILLVAMGLAISLHRSSASIRHQVWLVTLAGLLVLPAIATWAPLGIRVLPATAAIDNAPNSGTSRLGAPALRPGTPASEPGTPDAGSGSTNASTTTSPASHPLPLGTILLAAWAIVAALLLGRLLHGVLAVRRIVRGAQPLDDPQWQDTLLQIADRLALEQPPMLLRSEAIHMPFAAGVRRSLIVLPASCDQWTEAQREAVLIHELGHVRRHDMVGHTLGRVACALYWFHPLVWSAARRLRDASERACDDLAIRLGAVPSDYAQHLLDIVTRVRHANTPTAAIAMARRKEFEGRMLAILDPALHRGDASRWRTGLLSLCLAGFVLAVSAAAPARRNAAPHLNSTDLTSVPPVSPDSGRTSALASPERAAAPAGNPSPRGRAVDSSDHGMINPLPLVDSLLRHYKVRVNVDLAGTQARADEKMDLLIRVLRTDSSGKVRRVAAWGLEHYNDVPAAQAELERTLSTDKDGRVREMAAWALGQADGAAVVAALRTAAASDADDQVREMAVWGLGTNGDASSMDVVINALSRDSSDYVRGTAAWAIGQLHPDRAPPALVAMLNAKDGAYRMRAAWALSEIGDSTTLPAIRAALSRTDNDDATTRALLRAMAHIGVSPASMNDFLKSANPELRLFALKSLTGGGGVDPWPWPWPRPIPFP